MKDKFSDCYGNVMIESNNIPKSYKKHDSPKNVIGWNDITTFKCIVRRGTDFIIINPKEKKDMIEWAAGGSNIMIKLWIKGRG